MVINNFENKKENKYSQNKKLNSKEAHQFYNNKYNLFRKENKNSSKRLRLKNLFILCINNTIINCLIILILLNLFISIKALKEKYNLNDYFITLKIKNKGNNIKILGNENIKPNEIYINGEKQNSINCYYDITNENSEIKLVWKNLIYSTSNLFYGCSQITEIDLSNFETFQVTNMQSMFQDCSSLKTIDFSNFDTSNVQEIRHIFWGCASLTSIDLSNFILPRLTIDPCHMFQYSPNIKYISIKNGRINSLVITQINQWLSLDGIALSDTNLNLRDKVRSWNKIINCFYNNNNKFTGYIKTYSNNNICNFCGTDYYKIYNDPTNTNSNYNCYKELEGYYLDKNDFIFKKCYTSCKKCEMKGNITNHNCIECLHDFIYELENLFYKNCYEICPYYFYYDNNKTKYYCTPTLECPDNYEYLILAKNECIYNCNISLNYKYEYKKMCFNKCPKYTFQKKAFFCDDIKTNDEFIIYMRQQFYNELNLSLIKEGNDIEEKRDNILVTITTTDNQRKNMHNENKTSFNLGKCEDKLKSDNNITINDSALYIFKVEIKEQGMKIPIVLYEIYYPLFNETIYQLDLSICKNEKIDIFIPIILNDTIDKYNSSSDYYNNICSKANSKNGAYIPLNDRKNEFINNNMTICEEKCKLDDYDNINKKAKCSCEIKIKFPILIDEIKFDKNELYKSFTDIKNIANLNLIKCYKSLFKFDCIIKNYGFYIFIFIIFLFFICLIIFCCQYKSFKNKMHNLYSAKIEKNKIDNLKEKNINIKKTDSNTKTNNKLKSTKQKKIKIKSLDLKDLKPNKKIEFKNTHSNLDMVKNKTKNKNKSNKEKIKSYEKILKYNDTEMNNFIYKQALKKDKRTFFQYYISLLKLGHLLIFSFYNNRDYNIRIIKMFLFFFFFAVHTTINALFFNDNTMHTIYIEEGDYNIIYQIPQILYSFLISSGINALINFLSLSENDIIKFKNEKMSHLPNKYVKLKTILKIKFTLFFIIALILLIFFWYYISCFCCIYANTQIHLIKDSCISFCLPLLYPFAIYLLPAMLRLSALKSKKKNKEFIYKISLILQLF